MHRWIRFRFIQSGKGRFHAIEKGLGWRGKPVPCGQLLFAGEQAQRLALTDQRAAPQPTPQRGFWSRLFSRQGDSPSGGEA